MTTICACPCAYTILKFYIQVFSSPEPEAQEWLLSLNFISCLLSNSSNNFSFEAAGPILISVKSYMGKQTFVQMVTLRRPV